MRSSFTLGIVCMLVLTVGAQGQSPAPGPEHKRLEAFVGNWTFQGEAKAAPGQPAGKITGTDGKSIFGQAGCGSCHTLKDAGTNGTVGPNLDQVKPPEARVVTQVTNGGAVMPAFKDRLSSAQIQAVAKYVASVAG